MKLTISKIVAVYDKSSKGVAYVAKNGKPYKKATLKFVETGEKLVGANQWDGELFKEGQELDGEIETREYNGKQYFDLKVASKKTIEASKLAQLEFTVAKHDFQLKQVIEWMKKHSTPATPMPNFDVDSKGKEVGTKTVSRPVLNGSDVKVEVPDDIDDIDPNDIPF